MVRATSPYRPEAPSVVELAAGAVVTRNTPGPTVLLLHHREEERWCLPKGHVDPGESLGTAAAREVREESGLEDVTLGRELGEVHYRFFVPARALNVLKTTVFFLGRSEASPVKLEPTFDRFAWADASGARADLPYETERTAVGWAFAAVRAEGAPDSVRSKKTRREGVGGPR